MKQRSLGKELLFGAMAGFIGTLAIQALTKASEKVGAEPPMRDDPGKFMVRKAKETLPKPIQRRIPPKVESTAANWIGMAYGMTFGALYGLLRPRGGGFGDGITLGLGNWAIGYLGWLPASGLMPPIREHTTKQIIAPLVEHAVYGTATVATYDLLRRSF